MTDKRRAALVAFLLSGVFGAVVALLLHIMPQPLRSVNYFIAGGAATVLCLAVLFCFLMSTTLRAQFTFLRRR